MMRVGVIGCGYVFDHYMSTFRNHPDLELAGVADLDRPRAERVAAHYGTRAFATNADLLADAKIELVLNLTCIASHVEVTRAALEAGKHVYSEKPFTVELEAARDLIALADAKGLRLSGAPCNAMSESVQTLWRCVREGAVGEVRVVYAEFDDNPIYLMQPETWRSRTGAPWPYLHEYEAGCTYEHAGYYLSWLAAMFGPVASITSFSRCLIPDKTDAHLDPADTPDFSVACLQFRSGVTARLTCSIVAPFDQRLRIIGDQGELSVNTYRDYFCPVRLERFSSLTLNARKARWVRENSLLQWLLGVGGRPVGLLSRPGVARQWKLWKQPVRALKGIQLGVQDKCRGVAEMVEAIKAGRAPWLTPEFVLHITELTLAMQAGAGTTATTTSFTPLEPLPFAKAGALRIPRKPSLASRIAEPILRRLHAH